MRAVEAVRIHPLQSVTMPPTTRDDSDLLPVTNRVRLILTSVG
jgi:hypothetical protein